MFLPLQNIAVEVKFKSSFIMHACTVYYILCYFSVCKGREK